MTGQKPEVLTGRKIAISLFGFVLFWAILTDAWGYSAYIFSNCSSYIGAHVYGYLVRIVWVAPAVFLIIKYSTKLQYSKKALFAKPKLNLSIGLASAISSLSVFVGMTSEHNGFWYNGEIAFGFEVVKYVVVGFVEETVFRGWGYNSLAHLMSHKKATIISTLFFILLHIPAYIIRHIRFGTIALPAMLAQCLTVLIFGIVFCWLLKKGKTIWNPIIVHAIYDLACVLFMGGT